MLQLPEHRHSGGNAAGFTHSFSENNRARYLPSFRNRTSCGKDWGVEGGSRQGREAARGHPGVGRCSLRTRREGGQQHSGTRSSCIHLCLSSLLQHHKFLSSESPCFFLRTLSLLLNCQSSLLFLQRQFNIPTSTCSNPGFWTLLWRAEAKVRGRGRRISLVALGNMLGQAVLSSELLTAGIILFSF